MSVKPVVTLKEARERCGLSRAQVASALGVSERTIYRYENHTGKRGIARAVLIALAELYGVELDAFEEAA